MRWLGRHPPEPEPAPQAEELEQRVVALGKDTNRAVSAAEEAMDRELRAALETMVGDRRRQDRGHRPQRRGT